MNKEEALKEARRLLKKSGADTSEMTDAEVVMKIKTIWETLRPKIEEIWRWMCDDFTPAFHLLVAALGQWYHSLPEEVRAKVEEE